MIHPDLLDPEKCHDNVYNSSQDIGEDVTANTDVDSVALEGNIHLLDQEYHRCDNQPATKYVPPLACFPALFACS